MLPPLTRVYVEIRPESWELEKGGWLHKIRVAVETRGHQYVQDFVLNHDDFESRFDKIFEMAKRTLHIAVEREAKKATATHTESLNGEAQEAVDARSVHAQG